VRRSCIAKRRVSALDGRERTGTLSAPKDRVSGRDRSSCERNDKWRLFCSAIWRGRLLSLRAEFDAGVTLRGQVLLSGRDAGISDQREIE